MILILFYHPTYLDLWINACPYRRGNGRDKVCFTSECHPVGDVYVDRVELLHGWRRRIIFMKHHHVPQLWSTTTDAEQPEKSKQRLTPRQAKSGKLHVCENKIFITNIHYMYWFSNCCGHFFVIIYRITRYVPIWMILNSSIVGWFRSSLFGWY